MVRHGLILHQSNLRKMLIISIENSYFVDITDQFCADTPLVNDLFNSYWERQLHSSGLTERDIELWKERRKLDKECPDIPCKLLSDYSCDKEHGDTPPGARIEQCLKWSGRVLHCEDSRRGRQEGTLWLCNH